MPFAATWMDLEVIVLSEVSQEEKDRYHRQIPYVTYIWNLKYGTNEFTFKTETDSQTQKTDLPLPWGGNVAEEWTGNLGLADANYYMQNG